MAQSLEDYIRTYMDLGWSVIPIIHKGKNALCKWKPYQSRYATEEEILGWLRFYQNMNVGIVTGKISGLVVLDIDGIDGARSLSNHPDLPETAMVKTGRGMQAYFLHPGTKVKNFAGKEPGLDLRGDGGYAIAPPSIHPSGAAYTWLKPYTHVAPLPRWVWEMSQKKNTRVTPTRYVANHHNAQASNIFAQAIARVAQAEEGERNHVLNREAFGLGKLIQENEITVWEAEKGLFIAATKGAGLAETEAIATIRSGIQAGKDARWK